MAFCFCGKSFSCWSKSSIWRLFVVINIFISLISFTPILFVNLLLYHSFNINERILSSFVNSNIASVLQILGNKWNQNYIYMNYEASVLSRNWLNNLFKKVVEWVFISPPLYDFIGLALRVFPWFVFVSVTLWRARSIFKSRNGIDHRV